MDHRSPKETIELFNVKLYNRMIHWSLIIAYEYCDQENIVPAKLLLESGQKLA